MNPEVLSHRIPFDQIVLGKKLDRGSQGVVFKGTWNGLEVAIKYMSSEVDPDRLETNVRVDHANILKLLKYTELPYCLVLELCRCSLYDVLYKETPTAYRVTNQAFYQWSTEIAAGMCYLHENNITHRDLKPKNVLLAQNNLIKICDFDLSKEIGTSLEEMSTNVGTTFYRAPESFKEGYTKAVDVWSYGTVMWEIISQYRPYYDRETVEMDSATYVFALRNRQLMLRFPSRLQHTTRLLFIACLHYEPEQRPKFKEILNNLKVHQINETNWLTMQEFSRPGIFHYAFSENEQQILDRNLHLIKAKEASVLADFEMYQAKVHELENSSKPCIIALTTLLIDGKRLLRSAEEAAQDSGLNQFDDECNTVNLLLKLIIEKQHGLIRKKNLDDDVIRLLVSQYKKTDIKTNQKETELMFVALQTDGIEGMQTIREIAFEKILGVLSTTKYASIKENCCRLLLSLALHGELSESRVVAILFDALQIEMSTETVSMALERIYMLFRSTCKNFFAKPTITAERRQFLISIATSADEITASTVYAWKILAELESSEFLRVWADCIRQLQPSVKSRLVIIEAFKSIYDSGDAYYDDRFLSIVCDCVDLYLYCPALSYAAAAVVVDTFYTNVMVKMWKGATIEKSIIEGKVIDAITSWDVTAAFNVRLVQLGSISEISQKKTTMENLMRCWRLTNYLLRRSKSGSEAELNFDVDDIDYLDDLISNNNTSTMLIPYLSYIRKQVMSITGVNTVTVSATSSAVWQDTRVFKFPGDHNIVCFTCQVSSCDMESDLPCTGMIVSPDLSIFQYRERLFKIGRFYNEHPSYYRLFMSWKVKLFDRHSLYCDI